MSWPQDWPSCSKHLLQGRNSRRSHDAVRAKEKEKTTRKLSARTGQSAPQGTCFGDGPLDFQTLPAQSSFGCCHELRREAGWAPPADAPQENPNSHTLASALPLYHWVCLSGVHAE
ncbi:homeobox protein HMX1 [Platysternon megacephalum]|uniref:Homeobox protein HMX1 n=1 Tax=Platysternon megacephalum TaxID=55544 RepID=A0A4D9EIW4_9SAUR|nr:homeobox protein HMX1 [Platysternon megacephalum]